jgi:N-acetylmuramoyl-L-alanine amidase
LANEVQRSLDAASGLPNRGVNQARFYVIRNTTMPSILTESCFISNPQEEALVMQPSYRDKLAKGIAQGIANYVKKYR